MATVQVPVSDMLVTVKSREIQRGMFAEMAKDAAGRRHFLAAAHLELVLADDYAECGQDEMAFRSRLSAASCFARSGQAEQARSLLEALLEQFPEKGQLLQHTVKELHL